MEISSEILESLVMDNKDVIEVLKEENVTQGDIIFESKETGEDSEETEIEEIIEIIEEVEEEGDETQLDDNILDKDKLTDVQETETGEKREKSDRATSKSIELYSFDENSTLTSQFEKPTKNTNSTQKVTKKQIINYDVDEDWQDEELERVDELDNNSELTDRTGSPRTQADKKHVNNQTVLLSSNRLDMKITIDGKMERSQGDGTGSNVEDDESTQEIVKNEENNLLYTVLGTKKQDLGAKQTQEKLDDQFVRMERLEENTIPVEGTIYYEGDNMETLYVAQAIDDNEQYQYDNTTIEQDEGQVSWETTNQETNQNQEEDNSQDQIFLHEDEDGQLYFKDASGTLQPVYLTEDGNYAIAENADDNVNKESQSKALQNSSTVEEDSFILPDMDLKSASSKQTTSTVSSSSLQDFDNEDNTVTISLIISEDENGQKRTQVIIPTTDNLKCDICNKSFKTSFQLLRHNRLKHAREEDITTRNFPCDSCPKRYPDQGSLARHRKTHTLDRPFQCLECHKNFPTSTALRRHLTLHNSQSRPLPCIYCGRRFMDKTSLAKHEESHMPNEQRKYTCDICQKTFHHITDLSMHKKHHDPDKKFDCEVCGREFNRLNNLQRHMLVHQQQQGGNEEILSCDVCGITYKFMSSLTRHMVTTHMNPEKLRQQAEEQRRKRENNYRKYLEHRKMYETQNYGTTKRTKYNLLAGDNDETA